MIFLFRSGTVQEKLSLIFRATKTHAQNLAKYATVYKLMMLILKHLGANPGKEGKYDTFLAGSVGGYLVFGRRSKRGHISSVSKQIVIFGKIELWSFISPLIWLMVVHCSFCTRMSLSCKTLDSTRSWDYPQPRTLETNISRCVAGIRGFKLGICHVAI